MRAQDSLDQQPEPHFDARPERAPNGAGVLLAVLMGTLCWSGLIVLFL